jgi:hypothetical protein
MNSARFFYALTSDLEEANKLKQVLAAFHPARWLVAPYDFRSGPFCGFESRGILPP